MKRSGRVGGKGLLYFEIVTTFALIIGMLAANLLKPGAGVAHAVTAAPVSSGGQTWQEFIVHIIPTSIVDAFAKGDIIQVLFFGILFGIGLKHIGPAGNSVISTFEKINKVLFNILKMIMKTSPLGAFGGMAYTIGKFGFGSLAVLGKLLGTFYLTGFLFVFVVLNLIARYYKFSLWKLLVYIKEEILIVLGSSSRLGNDISLSHNCRAAAEQLLVQKKH